MGDTQMKDYALAWVNKTRCEHGAAILPALRKGRRRVASECVIAASLRELGTVAVASSAYGTVVANERESFDLDHPIHVTQFVRAFDAGKFPELVADEVA